MASALTEISEKLIKENQLSLSNVEKRGKGNLEFRFEDKSYVLNLKSYQLTLQEEKPKEEQNLFEAKSPDGKWIAYTKDYIFLLNQLNQVKNFN